MKRFTLLIASSLAAGVLAGIETPANGALLISLDATAAVPQFTLAGATVLAWGPFSLMNTNASPPTVATVGGVQAVQFYDNGDSHLRSDSPAPDLDAYTIEVWAYRSTTTLAVATLFSWGNDEGATHAASLGYGNDATGGGVHHSRTNTAQDLSYAELPKNLPESPA